MPGLLILFLRRLAGLWLMFRHRDLFLAIF
jgi:hypothetical protein